jgi:hypothetical protein
MLGEYGLTEIHLRPQFIHIFGKLHYQGMVVILFIKEFWQEITFAIIPFWFGHIKSYPEFNLPNNQSYLSHILCVTANKKEVLISPTYILHYLSSNSHFVVKAPHPQPLS